MHLLIFAATPNLLYMKPLMFLFLFMASLLAAAQEPPNQAPYLRFPTHPPIQLLLGDSATRYTKAQLPKKKPVLVMIFSPECSHCQHTAEELVQNKEKWKDIHIVMSTMHPLWQMNQFVDAYKLSGFSNLVVGRDASYILPSFYGVHSLPYLAFYNKKGNLITGFEGSMPLDKILATFK
jgi:thioredoxin-related protein